LFTLPGALFVEVSTLYFSSMLQKKGGIFLRIQDDRESVGDKYSVDVFPTVPFFEKGAVSKRFDGRAGCGFKRETTWQFC